MLFVEEINFVSWQRGMLSKHSADAGFGQFVNILEWVCFRRDVYFTKVDKDYSSQICPNCGTHTGKKTLDIRFHFCNECGYNTTRDVAASQEVRNRGISRTRLVGSPDKREMSAALGHSVVENVCGLDATGSSGATPVGFPDLGNAHQEIGHDTLVGTVRSRKSNSRDLESPTTATKGA